MRKLHVSGVCLLALALFGCAASPLLTGGKVQIQLEEYDKAIELFKEHIQKNPQDPEGHLWLGIAHGRKGDYAKAADAFDEAIQLDTAYLQKFMTAAPNQYWGGAASYWVTYVNSGIDLMNEQNFEPALSKFLRAAEIQPDSSATHNYRGYVLSKLGKDQEACKAYAKAVDLGPRNVEAYLNLAACRLKEEKFDETIQLLNKAAEIDTASDRAYYLLGICCSQKEEYEDAEKAFKKATELNPKSRDAFYNLGIIHFKQDRPSEAIENFEKAIELAPDDEEAWYQVGNAQYKLEKFREAIEAFTRVIELDPTNADAYASRGYAYSAIGMKEEAYRDLNQAQKIRKGG